MPARTVAVKLTADAQGYLATIGKATLATQKFANQGSKFIGKHEQSITRLSNTAGVVGLALAAGLGVVVKASAEFESAMSAVAATGKDAAANLDGLRATAIQAGKATKFSAVEAAGGIEALAKAGVSASDIMGGALTGSLNLAAVGNLEVSEAAEVAAIAMAQFNLTGKDVPHVADLIAAGAGKAQGEVGDMAAAMKQSGLVASQFGVSLEENVGTLSAFANAGLLGSDAGTSFKTMLLQLASPSGKAAELMKDLGISAYDAQGQFVGISQLAEQLKDKLGPLAQAERDAALATIFGTDAIRAANVLYKEGGEGITKWTNDVNDAGFAAKAAAIKMDNLKGDIEKLTGSIETAVIGAGQGAQGPLRSLTQSLEGAVNAFSGIPPGAQSATLAIGAVAAGGLLAVAGIGKLAVGLNDTRQAFNTMAPAGSRARGAVVGLGKAAGVATTALIGLQVIGAIGRQIKDEFTPSIEEAIGSLVNLNKSVGTTELDTLFNIQTGRVIKDNINGIGEAFSRLAQNRWSDEIGEAFDRLTGESDAATTQIRSQFQAVDRALAQLDPAEAGKAFSRLAAEAARAGMPIEDLVRLFPAYRESVRTAAIASDVLVTSDQQLADIMSGQLPAGMSAVTDSTGKLTFAQKSLDGAVGMTNEELQEQIDNFTVLREGALDVERAETALSDAYDAMAKSAKGSNNELHGATKGSRRNREAVIAVIEAINDKITADVKEKGSTEGSAKALKRHQEQLVRDAVKAGLSEDAVRKMIKQFMKTPKELETEVKTPGMGKAIESAKELRKRINSIDNRSVRLGARFAVAATKAAASFFKTVPGSQASGFAQLPRGFASGGPVKGPGTGTSDTAGLYRLSHGEHVFTAREVKSMGGQQAVTSFRKSLPGLAQGGPVNRNLTINTRTQEVGDPMRKTSNFEPTGTRALASAGALALKAAAEKAVAAGNAAVAQNVGANLPRGGNAIGRGQGALIRYGRMLGMGASTYAGHHPTAARARDFSPVHGGRGAALAGHAWAHAKNYGIWYVIWNRRIASRTRPGAGWAPYRRSNPHTDHVHVSWYDKGGILRPGWTMAFNGTGRNERVTPAGGDRPVSDYRFAGSGMGGGGMGTVIIQNNHYHFDRYIGNRNELIRELVDAKRQARLDVVLR